MYPKLLSINTLSSALPYHSYMNSQKFTSMRPTMSLRPSRDVAKTVYHDSWLDLLAINYLSHNLQAVSGIAVEKEGYDGLVETCRAVTMKYSPVQQRQLCLDCLKKSFPTQVFPLASSTSSIVFNPTSGQLKALIPHTKFARELIATFAGLLFVWLVGPSEVKESELDGKIEKNVVHIQKCRFLESSNCVGMCTNLCKFPSQEFIKESLGVPITMFPNFEDMSCEMIFGEEPPPLEHDPVTKQPCYNLCKIKKRHSECSS